MNWEFFYSVFHFAAGWVGLLGSTAGLRRLILPRKSEQEVRELLPLEVVPAPDYFTDLTERLRLFFSGYKTDFPDRLDISEATPFQRKVWQATRLIPYGQTRSYQWLAEEIGRPAATHAVGQALGKNPLPIIIPCHRVLASDGGLGGYSGGLESKKLLLELERANSD